MFVLYEKLIVTFDSISVFITNIMDIMFKPMGELLSSPHLSTFWAGFFSPLRLFFEAIGWKELTILHLMFVVGVNVWVIRFLRNIFNGD